MRILFVSGYPMIDVQGGREKVYCTLASELVARGHEVEIVGMEKKKEGKPFFPLDERVKLVNLYYQGRPYGSSLGYYLAKAGQELSRVAAQLGLQPKDDRMWAPKRSHLRRAFADKLQEYMGGRQPDIIIVDFPLSMYVAQVAAKGRVPIVGQTHNAPVGGYQYMQTCEAAALAQMDVIQVLLPSFKDFFIHQLGAKRVVYIPNVVEEVAEEEMVDLGVAHHTIISVGRVARRQKRHYLLLEAFGPLARQYPDWKVVICGRKGSPSYMRELTGIVNKYAMQEQVVFAGAVKNVQKALREADFFVFPSVYEGFPLALTEAMSLGLPAIGYKACPAVNELIEDGVSGLLCNDGVEPLREAMETLMLRQDLRIAYGRKAHEAMKKYAPQVVYDQWEALLKETVAAHKARQANSEE